MSSQNEDKIGIEAALEAWIKMSLTGVKTVLIKLKNDINFFNIKCFTIYINTIFIGLSPHMCIKSSFRLREIFQSA